VPVRRCLESPYNHHKDCSGGVQKVLRSFFERSHFWCGFFRSVIRLDGWLPEWSHNRLAEAPKLKRPKVTPFFRAQFRKAFALQVSHSLSLPLQRMVAQNSAKSRCLNCTYGAPPIGGTLGPILSRYHLNASNTIYPRRVYRIALASFPRSFWSEV